MTGKFIVVDGIDGCGKGTIIKALYDYLLEKTYDEEKLVKTFEPTEGEFGRQAREILKSEEKAEDSARQCLELYVQDRREHVEKEIKPALLEDKIVLCDRYKYSTIAYQHAQGIPLEEILELHKNIIIPGLTLILDLPVNTALERIENDPQRNTFDKFEKKEFLEKVSMNFMALRHWLPKENIRFIDASGSREDVFMKVKREVNKLV